MTLRVLLGLVAAALVAAPDQAQAGEALKPAALVAKAEAIVVVEVKFGRGKAPGTATVVRTLRGPGSGQGTPAPKPNWLSLCLPDRKDLQQWLHRHPKWPARRLWTKALKQPGYTAIAFLVTEPPARGGGLGPYCGVEAMELAHTSLHPAYAEYLRNIETLAAPPR